MGTLLNQAVERLSGKTVHQLRKTPISEWRAVAEKAHKAPISFFSIFPWIGRGSVMRKYFISHAEVSRLFDDAVSHK